LPPDSEEKPSVYFNLNVDSFLTDTGEEYLGVNRWTSFDSVNPNEFIRSEHLNLVIFTLPREDIEKMPNFGK